MNSTSNLDLSGHWALRPLSIIGSGIGQASFLWREKNQENQEKKPLTKGWDKQQT